MKTSFSNHVPVFHNQYEPVPCNSRKKGPSYFCYFLCDIYTGFPFLRFCLKHGRSLRTIHVRPPFCCGRGFGRRRTFSRDFPLSKCIVVCLSGGKTKHTIFLETTHKPRGLRSLHIATPVLSNLTGTQSFFKQRYLMPFILPNIQRYLEREN